MTRINFTNDVFEKMLKRCCLKPLSYLYYIFWDWYSSLFNMYVWGWIFFFKWWRWNWNWIEIPHCQSHNLGTFL